MSDTLEKRLASCNNLSQGRRDCLTIMGDLLQNMHQPTRLTHILYRTNLSYMQTKKYLDVLIQMGLAEEVKEPHRSFLITERGRFFVQLIESHPRKNKLEDITMIDCAVR